MRSKIIKNIKTNLPFHLMLLPCVIFLIVFSYIPMYGVRIAFQRFIPARGMFGPQIWVGLRNFRYIFLMPDFHSAIRNTIFISFMKLFIGMLASITVAILLNELRKMKLRRIIQTSIYLPHFLSWIILAGIFIDILSPSYGIINNLIKMLGFEPIFFLGNNAWFPYVLILTDVWKGFGFGTILYLAAIVSIDPGLFESAIVDGANKWKQIWHITLPGLMPIIVLVTLLNIGGILNGNFDQVFNLYSPQVYRTGDILDTLVYRVGMLDANYSLSTAIGLFKSLISMVLISSSYYLAYKVTNYRIF